MLKSFLFAVFLASVGNAGAAELSRGLEDAVAGDLGAGPAQESMSLRRINSYKVLAWSHPNELWRLYGLEAVQLGRKSEAAAYFERAALYADKYSQHRLSLMYWHGDGVARDRSAAYVWADLAAERGYRDLLLIREKMWSELTESERDAVSGMGVRIFERFSDAKSKPRLERRLRYALVHATGSRTGATLEEIGITFPGNRKTEDIPGKLWARERWYPKEYWKEVDAVWSGHVEVQPLQKAPNHAPE